MNNSKLLSSNNSNINSHHKMILTFSLCLLMSNNGISQDRKEAKQKELATKEATAKKKTPAPTPPMGWNSWNTFKKEINEQLFIESANVLISSGLAKAGYNYVNIDDGWSGEEANLAIAERFPNGIGYLADYMHKHKLKLGLYTNWRSLGKEERDVKQWAEWNIDLIKDDAWKTLSTDPHWGKMQAAIDATGKPIVHSVHFSDEDSNPTNICEISNLWRITNDIQDYYEKDAMPEDIKSWAYSTLDIIDRMAEVSHLIKPGCWADADMFEIGNGKQTADEYKTQFSMWCLLPAPLLMGNDIRKMSNETKAILINKDAIAINQDPAVIPAKRIRKDANTELWSRKLADGSLCVVLLNKTKTNQKLEFTWDEIGLTTTKSATVRDLWQHKKLGSYATSFSIDVHTHGCAMLKITQD
jgi:alpha-galactosidase